MQEFVVNDFKDGVVIKIQVAAVNAAEAGKMAIRDYGLTVVSNLVSLTGTPWTRDGGNGEPRKSKVEG